MDKAGRKNMYIVRVSLELKYSHKELSNAVVSCDRKRFGRFWKSRAKNAIKFCFMANLFLWNSPKAVPTISTIDMKAGLWVLLRDKLIRKPAPHACTARPGIWVSCPLHRLD